jgi:RNA polymerase sigma factor (sigma-70 family)
MSAGESNSILRRLRSVLRSQDGADTPDAALLRRYVGQGDEAAFETLVRRHGPTVLGVCRRILPDPHDAEDAFQATFLVLVRKATGLRLHGTLGNWLYGVACRTARHARYAGIKRRAKEAAMPARTETAEDARAELLPYLDRELERLPEKYRSVIVLCELQGKTRREAARLLRCPEGTVASRRARGLALLAKRLARHGSAVTSGALAVALSERATASLPTSMVSAAVKAASLIAAGRAAAPGAVSVQVAALAEGVMKAALITKLKATSAVLFVVAVAATAVTAQGLRQRVDATELRPQGEEGRPALDRSGDPLPRQAIARLGTLRFRWPGGVWQAAVVPGGKQLLGLDSGAVVLWDATTGKEIRRFEAPAPKQAGGPSYDVRLQSLAVSPDGKTLAVGGIRTQNNTLVDCPLLLFDLATGSGLAEWPGHPSNGRSGYPLPAFVTPTLLVSAGDDGSVRLWDVTGPRELRRLALPANSEVSAVVPSPDHERIFVAGWDGSASFWTEWVAATGKLVRREKGLPGHRVKLALAPDGRSLALAMGMGRPPEKPGSTEMRLYAGPAWKECRRWQSHGGDDVGWCSVAFSPDGKTIATGGADGKVRRWDAVTGKEAGPVIDPCQRCSQNVAYLDADTLATFGFQNTVKFWDAATGKPRRAFAGSELQVRAVAYAPDGRHVAVGGGDAPVRVWDAVGGEPVASLRDGPSDVTCLEFSPDGKRAVSGDGGGRARLWDWAKGDAPVKSFSDDKSPLLALAFSPDGRRFATGDEAGTVRVWEVASGKLVHTLKDGALQGQESRATALAFTPDGQALLCSAFSEGIRRWDLATGKEVRRIGLSSPGHSNAVSGLVLSPGGRWAYSSGYDGSICVWEVGRGLLARVLREPEPGYNGPVSIALSRDGTRLAAGFLNHWKNPSVHLWDLTTGEVATRTGHRAPVTRLAFSPDGHRLVSGSLDTTALVWDVTGPGAGGKAPDDKALAGLWKDLGADDPKVTYAAVCQGAAAGDVAVARLKLDLRPAVVTDAEQVAALVRQLDSDKFALREQASRALVDLGTAAETPLREALAKATSPEIRRRLGRVLEGLEAEHRRPGNAVEVLDMIGTPAARRLLLDLAKGASGSRLTREARVAIDGLEKRR